MNENSAPPSIFSAARRAAVYRRAASRQAANPDAAKFLFEEVGEDVAERLAFMQREPARALVIGDAGGVVADRLEASCGEVVTRGPHNLDEERPFDDGPFDLIVNVGSLASVNDLPGALIHYRNALASGGIFMASLIGAGSLPVLRSAMLAADGDRPAPRVHPMIDTGAASALLARAGFARHVVDSHTLKVGYRSLDRLIADMRDHGMGNAMRQFAPPLPRAALRRAREVFSADDPTYETFELITLTGWKN